MNRVNSLVLSREPVCCFNVKQETAESKIQGTVYYIIYFITALKYARNMQANLFATP